MNTIISRWVGVVGILLAPVALAHPPAAIAVDEQGRVYFMQAGGIGVWMIDEQGKLGRHDGPGFHHIEVDQKGAFLNQKWPPFPDGVIRPVGKNPTLLCVSSFPVVIAQDGALYYPEAMPDGRVHILRMAPGEKATDFTTLPIELETSPDGKQTPALWIHGIAVGPDKNFYYTEKEGIRRIDTQGVVTTVVDKVSLSECVRPPALTGAREGVFLRGLDVAPDGSIYAASAGCSALLKVTPAGEVSVALQERDGWVPTDVAAKGDKLYVQEVYYNDVEHPSQWNPRVRVIAADGTVTTLATTPETPARPGQRLK